MTYKSYKTYFKFTKFFLSLSKGGLRGILNSVSEYLFNFLVRFLQFFIKKNPVGFFAPQFNRKYPYLSAAISALTIVVLVLTTGWFAFFSGGKQAQAAWWNDSWQYRKPITVANTSGAALTDFQVKILTSVDLSADVTAGKIRSDLGDLRFTDINGDVLPCWIEDATAASVDAWVKMSTVPTSGATIYMYYGNANAISAQDGNKTFEFFDDFSGSSVDSAKWTLVGTPTVNTVSGGILDFETDNGSEYLQTRSYTTTSGTAIRSKQKDSTSATYPGEISFGLRGGGGNGKFAFTSDQNCLLVNDGATESYTAGVADDNDYHIWDITWRTNEAKLFRDGVQQGETLTTNVPTMSLPVAVGAIDGWAAVTTYTNMDWILVRKYTSVDPTAAAPATEEKGTGPIAYWSFDEGYGTTANNSIASGPAGTLSNMATTASSTSGWQADELCVSGKCLAFDGSNDGVSISGVKLPSDNTTVSFWLKGLANNGEHQRVISMNSWSGIVFNQYVGYYEVYMTGTDPSNLKYVGGYLSAWHQFTIVTEGSSSSYYVDGNYIGVNATQGNPDLSNFTLTIGNMDGATFWRGMVDEFKIYNYSRTAAQIEMDYNTGLAGTGGAAAEGMGVSVGGRSPQWMGNGLVGWWKMDEASWNGTAGEVKDWSGNNYNGTAAGNATTAGGKFGNGGTLDGTGDFVSLSGISTTGTSWTFSTWAKADFSDAGWHEIWEGGNPRVTISVFQNKFMIYDTDYLYSTFTLADTNWHFYTLTQSGSSINFYVDGVSYGKATGASASLPSASGTARIGAYWDGWSEYWDGLIDETRIYNRALSDREVRDLYGFAPGPVAYWNMEEGTGQYAYDTSGNQNTGTIGASSVAGADDPAWAAGKFGKGLKFDGTDDYVATTYQLPTGSTQKTVAFWVYSNDFVNTDKMFVMGGTSSVAGAFAIGVWDGTGVQFMGYTAPYDLLFTSTFANNQWHHVAAAYDGVTLRLYLDGKLDASKAMTLNTQASNMEIGKRVSSSMYHNGKIDDVKIYNYARTPDQIMEDMNARGSSAEGGQGAASVSASGKTAVGYWKFDEGYGTTAYDSSLQKANGTISGATWNNQGKFGKALSFDGNDIITGFPRAKQSSTIEWWAKTGTGGYMLQQSFWNSSTDWFEFIPSVRTDNGYIEIWAYSALGGAREDFNITLSDGDWRDNKWHHYVVTFTGGYGYFYLDGVYKGSDTFAFKTWDTAAAYATNVGGARAYNFNASSYIYFNGQLDEVKLYDYVLTTDEIVLDYNKGSSMKIGAGISGDVSDDAVGWWKLDDGSGAVATNSGTAGSTYNGALAGNTSWTTGQVNGAASLDGTGDYVSVTDGTGSPLDITSAMTVSGWFYGNSLGGGIVCKGSSDAVESLRFHVQANYIYFDYGDGGQYADAAPTISTGQWHHFAGTVVAGAAGKIYLDGNEISSYSHQNAAPNPLPTNNDPLYIGGCWTGYSLNGKMDNVRLYNYARSASQIKADAATTSLNPVLPGAPVAEWKFEEGTGQYAQDTSGTGNTGTLGSGATADASDPVYASGKYGKGLKFDGSNDYVSAASSVGSMGTGNWSINFWWKSNGTQGNYTTIIGQGFTGSPSNGAWAFKVAHTTNIINFTYCTPTISDNLTSINPNDNKWHYISAVRNGTSLNLYMDNVLAGAITLPAGFSFGTGETTYIGYNPRDAVYANGSIDELKIYNYARTPAQVAWDYNKGKPVAQWKFDEGQGATVYDSSGNGYNGTNSSWRINNPTAAMLSQSGLTAFNASAVVNGVQDSAWHTDSSVAGAYMLIDTGSGQTRDYIKSRINSYSSYAGNYSIQYSDDNSTWLTAAPNFIPNGAGWHEIIWASVGAHRYWRLYLTNTPGSGAWLAELEMYTSPYVAGKFNKAFDFDGVDDYVNLGSEVTFSTDAWTVSLWFNSGKMPTDTAGSDIQNFINTSQGHNIQYWSIRTQKLAIWDVEGSPGWYSSNTTLAADTWYHALLVYDGNGNYSVYLNGKLDSSWPNLGTTDDTCVVRYFGTYGTSERFFQGKIDDIRIYNYGLTASQIKDVYNNGAIRFGP